MASWRFEEWFWAISLLVIIFVMAELSGREASCLNFVFYLKKSFSQNMSDRNFSILVCTQSSTQNAYYRYPASTACSFSQIAWCAFGEKKVSFAWNKVKRRNFAVDIITTGIVVDFPVSKMGQNWQANAYFDVFLFRWMKRTISSMKTNYYRINRCDETNVIAIRVNHLQKETILNQHISINWF